MPGVKHIAVTGKYVGDTFNALTRALWGTSGRLRGLTITPVAGNTAITVGPGAFIVNGITVEMTSVTQADAPTADANNRIPLSGLQPYGLIATTADANSTSPFVFSIVTNFSPSTPRPEAIIGYSDITGTIWTMSTPFGIDQIAFLKSAQQLTDEQLRLLTNIDGNLDNANSQHLHAGLISDKDAFEELTNLAFAVPPVPLGRPPVFADKRHSHANLLTTAELDVLTARGGVSNADGQHLHAGLMTESQRQTLTGGPLIDATKLHDHFGLRQASGIVINPNGTIIYVPQNNGEGTAQVRGLVSVFQGSIKLLVGSVTSGGLLVAIKGIRFKPNAKFWADASTSSFGACDPTVVGGTPIAEYEELFIPGAVSGVVAPVLFGTVFRWRGIDIKVTAPPGGRAFTADDYFVYNGIVANTGGDPAAGGAANGAPSDFLPAHERELSYAQLRLVGVIDNHLREGGFWSVPYL